MKLHVKVQLLFQPTHVSDAHLNNDPSGKPCLITDKVVTVLDANLHPAAAYCPVPFCSMNRIIVNVGAAAKKL